MVLTVMGSVTTLSNFHLTYLEGKRMGSRHTSDRRDWWRYHTRSARYM